MHRELKAFFDEHEAPTHASLEDVGALGGPILTMAGRARQQMLHYENLLHQAEMAPHDPKLDGKLEQMHQTIGHAKAQLDSVTQLARLLRHDFAQLQRYGKEWAEEIGAYEATQQHESGGPTDGADAD